ncbi:hypothetical protein ACLMJK_003803 [Lecanora helva]
MDSTNGMTSYIPNGDRSDHPNGYLNGHALSESDSDDGPNHISTPSTSRRSRASSSGQTTKPIAIIGMSCRFPGNSTSPEKLWEMLAEGRSGWSTTPPDRFNQEAFYHPSSDLKGTINTKGGHFLKEDISVFDAPFFNISPTEAKAMDPQQRNQLELAYEALENGKDFFLPLGFMPSGYSRTDNFVAGIPLEHIAGTKTAVFSALFDSDYNRIISTDREDIPVYASTGTGIAIQANRLSHFFNLKGPSLTLDTGCSASLVAFHLACQSILSGESEQAIVGGANLILDPQVMIMMSMLKFFSDDGRCYTFDDRGSGYGRGEGIACVVLKPLDSALAAGDPIRAVVRSTCVNQDGKTPGLTNPSGSAQQEMIRTAYDKARLDPQDTAYVEAHGTGTPAGDPVEAAAISAVFRESASSSPILVGSVKSNLGHLEATSGLAGIIKAVLTLEKGLIPPSINFEKTNKTIASQGSNITVARALQPWPRGDVRRVSVNGFGYGGTNAHLILEDAKSSLQERQEVGKNINGYQTHSHSIVEERARIFVLSSKNKDSISTIANRLSNYLMKAQGGDERTLLDDLAYTLASRRSALTWRAAIVAATITELSDKLQQLKLPASQSSPERKITFVFTGQGAQWNAMGRELIHTYPVFEQSISKATKTLARLGAPWDLVEELGKSPKTTRVHVSSIGQPLCTAIQLALVDLLESWNIAPVAVIGHSSGEIAAAYACKSLDFDSALVVAYHRGALADTIEAQHPELRGAMLAVGLSEQETLQYVANAPPRKGKLGVACVNSPSSVTVSGDRSAIIGLQSTLEVRQVFVRRLGVRTAYHSHHMECIADEYRTLLDGINPRKSDSIEFYSTVNGSRMDADLLDASYWVRNMVSQVRFSEALGHLCSSFAHRGKNILLEVGPHAALAGPIKQTVASLESLPQAPDYVSSLTRDRDAALAMLALGGEMIRMPELPWVIGHVIQTSVVYPAAGYIAMALEASRQHIGDSSVIKSYELRNITIGKALIVPDDAEGVEAIISLRLDGGSTRGSNEFCVISYSDKDGWSEHCKGQITINYRKGTVDTIEGFRESAFRSLAHQDLLANAKTNCQKRQTPEEFYSRLEALGLQYQHLFHSLVEIQAKPWESLGCVTIPNSAAVMPEQVEHSHVVHPASLDCCFQTSLAALMEADVLNQTLMPTFIEKLTVSSDIPNNPGSRLQVHCTAECSGHRGFRINMTATSNDSSQSDCLPTIEMSGMKLTSIGGGSDQDIASAKSRRICHRVHWAPDVEYLKGQGIKTICQSNLGPSHRVREQISTIRSATYQFIKNALHEVREEQVPASDPSALRFYHWMIDQAATKEARLDLSESAQASLFDHVAAASSGGALLCAIGHNLPRILRAEADPLSLMMENDLLSRTYHEDEGRRRNCAEVAAYVDMAGHKQPDLKILEIGAGTGSTALPVLESLGRGFKRRFESYTFTDISSGFFEKAEDLLQDWNESVSFQRLDIEKDPQEQGFKQNYYDLVIAGNIFHATSNIENTARNARVLLRPGGKLILIEGTRPAVNVGLIFGTLPGWWLGTEEYRQSCPLLSEDRWHEVLQRAGYSGVDACVPDYEDDEELGDSVLISTAIDRVRPSKTLTVEVLCLHGGASEDRELAASLSQKLDSVIPEIKNLDELIVSDKVYICLLEASSPMWKSCDSATFQKFKKLVSGAHGLLWVTRGGTNECKYPEAGLITGLARVARSENPQLRFVTMDLDPSQDFTHPDSQQAILDVFHRSFDFSTSSQREDNEFAVRGGRVLIPRFVEDINLIDHLNLNTSLSEPQPETQEFFQDDRPLKLKVGVPGMLDSLRFVDDPSAKSPLAADEIRINLRAVGVNFRDVLVSMGQLENSTRMAGECSGVVTAVGEDMKDCFNVGERICGWGREAYASSMRLKGKAAKVIPEGMDFEVAASIPIVWTTAYYSLVYLARLEKGESVLIHSAAGGVGQAAIMLAQHIGAIIFVTVGSEEKKAFLMDTYSIPEENVFSSRQLSFSDGIKRRTNNQGVDVVLNSLAGESIRASCECLASLGRFIEIGKRDILSNSKLEMAFFDRNVTFASVDLTVVFEHKIALGGWLLDRVFELINQGYVTAVSPINRMSISEIEAAFRLIQAGKHMGKVVLSAEAGARVQALPQRGIKPNLRAEASYLVVGGLGGLGRVICQWMADHGVKNIIVLSRSGLENEISKQFAADLSRSGTKLLGLKCDVSNLAQLEDALASVPSEMPPIRGVIQAAMVLKAKLAQDSLLENMTIKDYQDVIRPKVNGTIYLHELLSKQPLDFFLNLSSVAGLGGNHGQGNYAAASTFQDAFARSNKDNGCVIRSLDLGMIGGAGYVSENAEAVRFLLSQGYTAVTLAELLEMINYAITKAVSDAAPSQLTIGLSRQETTEMDPRLLEAKFSHLRVLESLRDLRQTTKDNSSLNRMLSEASSLKEAAEAVCTALIEKLSKLLAMAVDSISRDEAISTYGADSLVSVELRNWFSHQLEADMPVLEILGSKPISSLATDAVKKSKIVDSLMEV